MENYSIQQIGAKAFHLIELRKRHFRVPETLFIPLSAYRTFLAANHLQSAVDTVKKQFAERTELRLVKPRLTELRAAFTEGRLPASVSEIVEEAAAHFPAPLAVRSSAISEDGTELSFAGQYDTILSVEPDVDSLTTAVKKVWASQWKEAVAEYVLKNENFSFEEGMGVIVQRMLKPRIAGVLFTRRPDSLSDETMIIEYVHGLGEKLVSGEETPRHLAIPRRSDSSQLDRLLPLGFKEPLKELVGDALKIEKFHSGAVDIEWAVENRTVYFLQYRPLTTGAEETLWTNENVGEVIPDVVTPYSWSILKPITNNAFAYFLSVLGIKDFPEQGLFELYKGRVYFNSTQFNRLLSGFYIREQLKGRSPLGAFVFLTRKIPAFARLSVFLLWLPAAIKRYLRNFPQRLGSLSFAEEGSPAWHLDQHMRITKQQRQTMRLHLTCTIFAELYYQLLTKLCAGKETAAGAVSADALLSGIQGAESARSGRALWQLAKSISVVPALRAIVLNSEGTDLETRLRRTAGGPEILGEMQSFLNEFGHGALHEFELYYPRWQEDKNFIYSNLKNYLKILPDFDWEAGQNAQNEKQAEQLSQAVQSFSIFGRIFFRWVFHKARFFSTERENLKQAFVKLHFELKKHLSVLAKQLNLHDIRKILFLTDVEITQALAGELPGEQIRALIKNREEERSGYLTFTHPVKIRQVGKHWIPIVAENPHSSTELLNGIGCSAGIVEGTARIILNPENSGGLAEGEILIARAVNPGWTPMFVSAAGLACEIGGALSHGAIIAREYGLPMVTAVAGLTTKIRDGQRIRLDGFSGTIEILTEEE